MPLKYFFLFIHLLVFSAMALCQDSAVADDKGVPDNNLNAAKFQIFDIKNRGVIVRLKTNKDRIDAYRKSGNKKIADQMAEKCFVTNLLLEHAFIAGWTFCPVYFMESQNTSKLLLHDTLIAKTFDLLRDTAIYVNADSFYIVDFGVLMENQFVNNPKNYKHITKSEESSTVAGDDYLVMKDATQHQLQPPIPFSARVIFASLASVKDTTVLNVEDKIAEIDALALKYPSTADILQSPDKQTLKRYLNIVYDHLLTLGGDRFTKAVDKYNTHFIEYYCKRLALDNHTVCQSDLYYWWLRNPNIRYLQALPALELQLKKSLDAGPRFIKMN